MKSMKKLFGMLMLASVCCGNAYADNVNVGEGEYYLRTNVGTMLAPEYKYLEAGGQTWGTAAVIGKHGLALTIAETTDNDVYSIAAVAFNDKNATPSAYFDGAYFDRGLGESKHIFYAVKNGSEVIGYKIKATKGINGNGYLTLDSNDGKTINKASDSGNAIVWEVISKDERMAELKNAASNYPEDATFLIHDHSFSRMNSEHTYWCINSDDNKLEKNVSTSTMVNDVAFYVGKSGSPENNNNNNYDLNLEIKGLANANRDYDLYQTLYNLPKGKYRLSVYGFSGAKENTIFYAKDENGIISSTTLTSGITNITNGVAAAKLLTGSEQYKKYIEFIVSGDVKIGVKGTLNKNERTYIDNFELTYLGTGVEPTLSLADDVDNSLTVRKADNMVSTATLTGRTINVGGYNTLSLPFSASKDAIDHALGKGNWSLKTLADITVKDCDITLVFDDAHEIEAGKPYLVSVEEAVSNPTFHHVLVDANAKTAVEFENKISFVPVLYYSTIGNAGDDVESMLFLGGNNTLYCPLSMPAHMRGNRAYFHVEDTSILNAGRRFSLDIDSEATAIKVVNRNAENTNDDWYTVNGTRLSGKPSQAGLYINNGKKVIIK